MSLRAPAISTATRDDLPLIAALHIRAWQQAYRGLISQSYLDDLTSRYDERLARLRARYDADHAENGISSGRALLVARTHAGITGFAHIGPGRDDAHADMGEIFALYIDPPLWGAGMGYTLFRASIDHFGNEGRSKAYLWVLDGNTRAHSAYLRWGGSLDPLTKEVTIGEEKLLERKIVFHIR